MKLQFPAKDVSALSVVTLLAVLANLPRGYGSWLVNRDTLLLALGAVVVIALFHYLKAFLLMCITTLAVGANLPKELAESLGISQGAMLAALAAIIGITLLNRHFNFVPLAAGADDELDEEDTVTIELPGPHERLIQAIEHGRITVIRQLIAADTNINFKLNGTTPLHVAAEKGYSAIVQILIEAGADLLAENFEGETPLDVALTLKKHAKTTDILYKATIPLLAPVA
jgi:Ankyrin repeats (3 copies)